MWKIEATFLVEAWVLADRQLMPSLQSALMDRLREGEVEDDLLHLLNYAYESTTTESPLRKFLVSKFITSRYEDLLLQDSDVVPRQMLIDMLSQKRKTACYTCRAGGYFIPGNNCYVKEN
jgi:hypothetical protein